MVKDLVTSFLFEWYLTHWCCAPHWGQSPKPKQDKIKHANTQTNQQLNAVPNLLIHRRRCCGYRRHTHSTRPCSRRCVGNFEWMLWIKFAVVVSDAFCFFSRFCFVLLFLAAIVWNFTKATNSEKNTPRMSNWHLHWTPAGWLTATVKTNGPWKIFSCCEGWGIWTIFFSIPVKCITAMDGLDPLAAVTAAFGKKSLTTDKCSG